MIVYIIRRLLLMVPTLVGASILVFTLTQFVPGGPVENLIRQMKVSSSGSANASVQVNDELREQLNKQFGFDKPVHIRYFNWLGDLLRFDFGKSYEYQEPVWDLIVERFPVSLTFGIWSFLLTYLLCIPMGIWKAVKDGSRFDYISSLLLFLGYSMPSFSLAVLLIVLFGGGSFFDWFPVQGLHSDGAENLPFVEYVLDYLHHIVLPLFCYVIGNFATLTFLMKNSFIDQINLDYVRTARAKGLPDRVVYFRHVLRNALIPIATGVGSYVGIFLTGSILLEQIFGIEGISLLFYNSIMSRDYPIALALVVLGTVSGILGNLLSDLLYVVIDPRIDFDAIEN